MAKTFYRCNPELFEGCPKTSCQKECILTTHEKYALRDEFGRPIVAECENKDFIKAIRADIMHLQTYKLFEGEKDVYIERDDVLKILDKYKAGGENEETDSD